MAYRKLKVKGEEHQFSIGKSAVKIKTLTGNKIFLKDNIFKGDFNRNIVTTGMVRDLILYGKLQTPDKYFSTCECKNVKKHIGCLPFDEEIYGKLHYVYFCEHCFNDNAGDI